MKQGDCQQVLIRFRAPDGRVHSMCKEEFERRKREEVEKMKTKLAIKELEVCLLMRLVRALHSC